MRLSARNIIKGKVLEVKLGSTTALALKVGDAAYAVIKASDVMVGKD